jgi:hypothetical protein
MDECRILNTRITAWLHRGGLQVGFLVGVLLYRIGEMKLVQMGA